MRLLFAQYIPIITIVILTMLERDVVLSLKRCDQPVDPIVRRTIVWLGCVPGTSSVTEAVEPEGVSSDGPGLCVL